MAKLPRQLPLDLFRSLCDFEAAKLARHDGRRCGATELRQAYLEWAEKHGRPALSFAQLRAGMTELGYRHLQSNRMFYLAADLVPEERQPRARTEFRARLRPKAPIAVPKRSLVRAAGHLAEAQRQLSLLVRL